MFSFIFLYTSGPAHATTNQHFNITPPGAKAGAGAPPSVGNGKAVWSVLADRDGGNNNVVRRSCSEKLVSRRLRPDEEPEELLEVMDAVRDRLAELGDPVSDAHYEDILLSMSSSTRVRWIEILGSLIPAVLCGTPSSIAALILLLPRQCRGLVPLYRRRR